MKKKLAFIFSGFILLMTGIWTNAAMAQDAKDMPEEARAFIQTLAEQTLDVLDDIRMTQDERDAEFHRLLKDGFEIEYLSKLVLGRHRRTASPDQMARFQGLFPDYIINIYADKLKEYGDERFYVTGTSPAGKKDVYVHSEVTRAGRNPFAADWRVRFMNGQLRVIDIKIKGISMLQTQRDEFSARISNVGMEGLIEDLHIKAYGEAS